MRDTQLQVTNKRNLKRLLVLSAVLLGVFAVYAPALRLMPFYDDIGILPIIRDRNYFNIFILNPADENYRPLSYVLWLLVRDLFGFFLPSFLHAWNVWLHTLNMALLAALTWQLAGKFKFNHLLFTTICLLLFGLYPFSYEAVLWAAAVNHVLMVTYGLIAILIYLSARKPSLNRRTRLIRFILSGLALLAACLSHEMGYIYGVLLLLVELVYAYVERRRPCVAAIVLMGLDLTYPFVYQAIIHTMWSSGGVQNVISNASAWYPNALIHAQGMVAWVIVLVRNIVGLPEPHEWIVLVAFVVTIGVALAVLWRARRLQVGLFALGWWVVAILPSTIWLSQVYMSRGPRLLYEPSIGMALFWAATLTCVTQVFRYPAIRVMLVGCIGIGLYWSGAYIGDQRDEIARLTPALNVIDADIRQSVPDAKVLLINVPYWNMPTSPTFMIGAQGMQFFQEGNDPVINWLASVSGVYRKAESVRHDISLTHGDRYNYGIPGNSINDTVLREKILAANYIYRFDYDAPGLRARRLAILQNDPSNLPETFASFAQRNAHAGLRAASAINCEGVVKADLTWAGVSGLTWPTGVFVHGFDAQNQQVAVADRDLVDGYLPLEMIPNGVVITETRIITALQGTAPMTQLRIGLYNRVNGERFAAAQANGVGWEGDEVVVPIQPKAENCGP